MGDLWALLDDAGWFVKSFIPSLAAGVVLVVVGWAKGWWWRKQNPGSVDLATRVYTYLDGSGEKQVREAIWHTKQLGDYLVAALKVGNPELRTQDYHVAKRLISDSVSTLKSLVAELTAANKELDYLKRASAEYLHGLEERLRIIDHLTMPNANLDAAHARSQLLDVNTVPNDLRQAALGEAALFLRGYGTSRTKRIKYYREILRKHFPRFRKSVADEYRRVLQQTALHKARK